VAVTGVHQFVPMLHVGDAVGRHTLGLQALLRERGVASDIFVELPDPETEHLTRPADAYEREAAPGDVLVYQFATPSALAGWLAERPETLVVNYHNVTPPEFFAPWDNLLARRHAAARAELARLAERAALGVAVSELNRRDLLEAGFGATRVIPPIVDRAVLEAATDSRPAGQAPPPAGVRWLAVGRLAPNKALEEVVAALLLHRARHDPAATLSVVGRPALEVYAAALRAYVAELGLSGAVRFEGRVGPGALAGAYRSADVLVTASEHEGFCLPVVEAMAYGLPVVARRRGAVPEVLGDAGVLVDEAGPTALSEAAAALAGDAPLRSTLVDAGRRRVGELGLEEAGARLAELLVGIHGGAHPGPEPRRR